MSTAKSNRRIAWWSAAGFLICAFVLALIFFYLPRNRKIKGSGFNLLLITLDTTRADRIGAYGYQAAQTPNLDRLAREGVRFSSCLTPVPLTLPAHCSLFTGRYPMAHQVRNNGTYVLPEREQTLAEAFQVKGYQTYAVVASFVLLAKFGLKQGFSVYDDSLNSHKMMNNFMSKIPASAVFGKFSHSFAADTAEPFFAWIHFYDPHTPYEPPAQFAGKFPADDSGRYNGEIAFMDHYVGQVIEFLRQKNLLEKTLVVLVGDHGEAFGEHQEYEHGIFCYQETLWVPLIFYNPRLFPKGRVVTEAVNLVDIMPTLSEMYGLPLEARWQGRSLTSLLTGKKPDARDFYLESLNGQEEMGWAPLTGIISWPHKYVSLPQPELYDLKADAAERHNLFWTKNALARELDNRLQKMILAYAEKGAETRRELSQEDRRNLQSLGYISTFSEKAKTMIDPKQGIILDNTLKGVLKKIARGELDQAERELTVIRQAHAGERLSVIYDLLYQLYAKKNMSAQVMAVLREAMTKFPELDRFYIMYGNEAFARGLLSEAEAAGQELLRRFPNFTRAYILLGQIAEKRNQAPAAITYYRQALAIELQNVSLKIKCAELLIGQQQFADALILYNELAERPEIQANPDMLFKIALFQARFGSLPAAATLLTRVVQLQPSGKNYYHLALVQFKLDQLPEALQNMETALNSYGADLDENQRKLAGQAIAAWRSAQ